MGRSSGAEAASPVFQFTLIIGSFHTYFDADNENFVVSILVPTVQERNILETSYLVCSRAAGMAVRSAPRLPLSVFPV
jgi:hypothetical protein